MKLTSIPYERSVHSPTTKESVVESNLVVTEAQLLEQTVVRLVKGQVKKLLR